MTLAIANAESTRALSGASIKTLGPMFPTIPLILVGVIPILVAWAAGAPLITASLVGFTPVMVGLVLVRRRLTAATRANNDAVEALARGEIERAEEGFRSLVTRRYPSRWTALGLLNLATVAIRRCEFSDAVALSRAALELQSAIRPRSTAALLLGHLISTHALGLLGAGELDEAEAVLKAPIAPGTLPLSAALLARSRLVLAVRREQFEQGLAIFDAERSLMRNVLTGKDAVLVDAIEAWCLTRLADRAPRPAGRVAVDEDERSFVTRVLPGSEVVLVAE